jgi:hypothetical protein
MKNISAHRGQARAAAQSVGLKVVPAAEAQNPSASRVVPTAQPVSALERGIVVREEELGSVKAQRLYKMRCECGRSWFELELPTLIECPACKKLCLVGA